MTSAVVIAMALMITFSGLLFAAAIMPTASMAQEAGDTTLEERDETNNCNKAGESTNIGVRNPAAVYCMEMGYEYKIEKTNKGERGICVMPNNEECDAWAFYSGECGAEFSYCAKKGWLVASRGEKDSFATNCTTCVLPDGSCKTVSELLNFGEKCTVGMKKLDENKRLSDTELNEKDIEGEKVRLPRHFDWRNKDGENWMTPVKDQGSCGSCWAFSAVGTVEPVYNIAYGNPNLDLDLSEQYLVSDCHTTSGGYQSCCGGWKDIALKYIRDYGITDEACFPYVDATGCTCSDDTCDTNCNYCDTTSPCSDATCSDRCSDWSSRLKKIDETGNVPNNKEAIKDNLIEKGPLAVSMGIGSEVGGNFVNGIYRCDDDSKTNHAVVIAGYDETEDYWIVRNSWGSNWNGNGYFKVGYGECSIENYVDYAWYRGGGDGKPDLEITDIWHEGGKIYYMIKNIGTEEAGSSRTSLAVDGVYKKYDSVRSLGAGEERTESFRYDWTCTGTSDEIEVCADYKNAVAESEEGNNCRTVTWECPESELPDLVITDIWHEGSKIYYKIKNIGTEEAGSSRTSLTVDGDYKNYDSVRSLGPGAERTESFRYDWTCTGTSDEIEVCADYRNAVAESEEGNNCRTVTWECPESELPDLVITDIWHEGSKIYYKIKNIGAEEAGSSRTGLWVDGVYKKYDSVRSLGAGEERTESFRYTWACTEPSDEIKVCADYNNAVAESEEGNNCRTVTWECPEIELPDLVITDIWHEGSKVYYKIKNIGTEEAGSSRTSLTVDGVYKKYDSVRSLGAGEERTESFRYTWACTEPSDEIKVCADYNNAVAESEEGNNCRTETWECEGGV